MKKNSPSFQSDIDLVGIFKIIWHGKIKILLITLILFLAAVVFEYKSKKPTNYLNSLTIYSSESGEFIKLDNTTALLNMNESAQSNKVYLHKFIYELRDYEEFFVSLKNTKKIREHISKIKIEDQEKLLFNYAKSLEIVSPKDDDTEIFTLNFEWDDPDEAKKILIDTLNHVSENLKKSVSLELSTYLEYDKKIKYNRDKERLDYLYEQSAIAKELNIVDNQLDNFSLPKSSVSFNINIADLAYYLRGYKAIDKEIELIRNRDYKFLTFVEEEIESLKKENIKWVQYNIYLMKVNLISKTKSILAVSILMGLIVGVLYLLISNTIQSHTYIKKNK